MEHLVKPGLDLFLSVGPAASLFATKPTADEARFSLIFLLHNTPWWRLTAGS